MATLISDRIARAGQVFGCVLEARAFVFLVRKRSDDSDAGEVFSGNAGDCVQLFLHGPVMGDGAGHYHVEYESYERSRREEHERELEIYYHSHDRGADDKEWRADKQTYHHRNHVLQLVHVRGQTVYESCGAEFVKLLVRQLVDVREQVVAEQGTVSLRAL